MPIQKPDTDELLRRVNAGDASAAGALLDRHRARLRQMVAVRIDPRLAARVDPSDVVQEALAEASRKLLTGDAASAHLHMSQECSWAMHSCIRSRRIMSKPTP